MLLVCGEILIQDKCVQVVHRGHRIDWVCSGSLNSELKACANRAICANLWALNKAISTISTMGTRHILKWLFVINGFSSFSNISKRMIHVKPYLDARQCHMLPFAMRRGLLTLAPLN